MSVMSRRLGKICVTVATHAGEEALGQNPQLTQGQGTCLETVKSMGHAIKKGHACKAQLINYWGTQRTPFWNLLNIIHCSIIVLSK